MKATIENLERVLRICAEAHNCDFEDWSEDGQFGLHSETPATICDVQMILDAFYGNHDAAEPGYGYVNIWLYASMNDAEREVDMPTLQLALPYGTEL